MSKRCVALAALILFASCSSVTYRKPSEIVECQDAERIANVAIQADPEAVIQAAGVHRLIGHYRACVLELDKQSTAQKAEDSQDFWSTTGKILIALLLGIGAGVASH